MWPWHDHKIISAFCPIPLQTRAAHKKTIRKLQVNAVACAFCVCRMCGRGSQDGGQDGHTATLLP